MALLALPVWGTLIAAAYPTFQTRHYNQTLDHFDPTSSERWSHRYLFRDDEWDTDPTKRLPNGCPGPILMYTGNEGPITAFWESNGFMVEYLAPKWGAMLVFPEERYYGESLPFGSQSFLATNLKYLTTEQARLRKSISAPSNSTNRDFCVDFGRLCRNCLPLESYDCECRELSSAGVRRLVRRHTYDFFACEVSCSGNRWARCLGTDRLLRQRCMGSAQC